MCKQAMRGFTLIELLVVIAIIAILAGTLFPVFVKARQRAYESTCLTNQRQIAVALSIYTQDNSGWYPPINVTWQVLKLPPKSMICPTAGEKVLNGYGISYGLNARSILDPLLPTPDATLISADALPNCNNIIFLPCNVSMLHSNGTAIMSFADGHVKQDKYVPISMLLDSSFSLWPPDSYIYNSNDTILIGDPGAACDSNGGTPGFPFPRGWVGYTYPIVEATPNLKNNGNFVMSPSPGPYITGKEVAAGWGPGQGWGLHCSNTHVKLVNNWRTFSGQSLVDPKVNLAWVVTLPIGPAGAATYGTNLNQCAIWSIDIASMQLSDVGENGRGTDTNQPNITPDAVIDNAYCDATMDVYDVNFKEICELEFKCVENPDPKRTVSYVSFNGHNVLPPAYGVFPSITSVPPPGDPYTWAAQWGYAAVLGNSFTLSISGGNFPSGASLSCSINGKMIGSATAAPLPGGCNVAQPAYLVFHSPAGDPKAGGEVSYWIDENKSGLPQPFSFNWVETLPSL